MAPERYACRGPRPRARGECTYVAKRSRAKAAGRPHWAAYLALGGALLFFCLRAFHTMKEIAHHLDIMFRLFQVMHMAALLEHGHLRTVDQALIPCRGIRCGIVVAATGQQCRNGDLTQACGGVIGAKYATEREGARSTSQGTVHLPADTSYRSAQSVRQRIQATQMSAAIFLRCLSKQGLISLCASSSELHFYGGLNLCREIRT